MNSLIQQPSGCTFMTSSSTSCPWRGASSAPSLHCMENHAQLKANAGRKFHKRSAFNYFATKMPVLKVSNQLLMRWYVFWSTAFKLNMLTTAVKTALFTSTPYMSDTAQTAGQFKGNTTKMFLNSIKCYWGKFKSRYKDLWGGNYSKHSVSFIVP